MKKKLLRQWLDSVDWLCGPERKLYKTIHHCGYRRASPRQAIELLVCLRQAASCEPGRTLNKPRRTLLSHAAP